MSQEHNVLYIVIYQQKNPSDGAFKQTFDKSLEFLMFNPSVLCVNLECHQQNKQELVFLIQASAGVAEHLIS